MTRLSRDAYGLRLAEAAASRADCTRRQVGAVIVAEDGSVVATGYNGLASGLPGCASAGACPRGQMAYPTEPPWTVGESDPTPDNLTSRESCPAFHTDAKGYYHECTCARDHEGWHVSGDGARINAVWTDAPTHPADVGYEATGCRAVHAEVNAIIRAGRDRCVGATIYVTDEPCFHCGVVIEGAGIARVVTPATIVVPGEHQEEGRTDWARALRARQVVHATVPPPSGATGAPTYATGGYVGPVDGGWIRDTIQAASDRAHALPAYARPTVTRPVFNGGLTDADLPDMWERADFLGGATDVVRTSGPLDPEVHAALVRSVERGRLAHPSKYQEPPS